MLGMGHIGMPWVEGFKERLVGVNLADSVRGHFTIPQLYWGATFRVLILGPTSGSLTLKLRFGFQDADADLATLGIDFATLNAVDLSDTRSIVWADGAAAPGADGSPPAFPPPRVSVVATTAAGTELDYLVLHTGVGLI